MLVREHRRLSDGLFQFCLNELQVTHHHIICILANSFQNSVIMSTLQSPPSVCVMESLESYHPYFLVKTGSFDYTGENDFLNVSNRALKMII